ncbi:MAG: hypothetical protein ABJC26_17975 [Gemmatimonadaceae bacterium]
MRRVLAVLAVVVMVWIVLRRDSSQANASGSASATVLANAPQAPPPTANPNSASEIAASAAQTSARNNSAMSTPEANSGKGFRDKAHLDEHFAKHGGEFAGLSEAQYLAAAQSLRDEPAGGNVLEIIRPTDGVVSRFDKRSGAFLAYDRDGTIRTFFKPNDGERYFRRQANRAPSP